MNDQNFLMDMTKPYINGFSRNENYPKVQKKS